MLSTTIPDLAGIELLEAVARHGSMSAAAVELGLSQQAVSLRIRAMERQVGVPLLIRSRRGCELTRAGRLLNEWSASLLADARQLAAGIATLRTDRQAHLRVAASLTIAEHLLPGWLLALHELQARTKQTPTDVELVAVNTDSVLARVRSGQSDFGFIEGPYEPAGLHARIVARDELIVVVAPDHPWARRRTPVPVALLSRTPMIRREPGSGSRQAFDDALVAALPEGAPLAPPALEVSTPSRRPNGCDRRHRTGGDLGPRRRRRPRTRPAPRRRDQRAEPATNTTGDLDRRPTPTRGTRTRPAGHRGRARTPLTEWLILVGSGARGRSFTFPAKARRSHNRFDISSVHMPPGNALTHE